MYLYALDLSMSCSGVVVFDLNTLEPVLITSIPTNDKKSHGVRLRHLAAELEMIVQQYEPSVIVIERTFNRFPTATAVLYKTHGVVNYLFHNYEQIYYSPKEIKKEIAKVGNATKQKVQSVIKRRYPEISFNNEDESDAFAIGLTWFIRNKKIVW